MFGFSLGELLLICVVALVAVGPKKLPGMLQTLGQWLRKIRNLTVEMRNQTGIDELLRSEGLHGGLNELRGLLRGGHHMAFDTPAAAPPALTQHTPLADPYANVDIDVSREYPLEGADAYGALPDDLLDDEPSGTPATDSSEEVVAVAAEQTATAAPNEPAEPEATRAETAPVIDSGSPGSPSERA